MKGSALVETMIPAALTFYAQTCGRTLARAHARSGDPVALAAYMGRKDRFERSIADFSERYADQNERDYQAFAERSGPAGSRRSRTSDRTTPFRSGEPRPAAGSWYGQQLAATNAGPTTALEVTEVLAAPPAPSAGRRHRGGDEPGVHSAYLAWGGARRRTCRPMVTLEGGSFRMGSVDARAYAADGEGPDPRRRAGTVPRSTPHAVTNARFADVRRRHRPRHRGRALRVVVRVRRLPARRLPGRPAAVADAPWWRQVYGADWRHPDGPAVRPRRTRRPSGHPRVVERRPGLLRVERHAAADGGRVGVRRARRTARHGVPVGRRARARRRAPDERVPGHVPAATTRRPTGSPARHPSTRSRRTASGCTT